VTAAFGRGLEHAPDHRHPVDVQQQLLRSRHPRAATRGKHDAPDRQQRRRQPLEGRPHRADPFHLDAGADGDLGEIAKAPAVPVNQQQAASNQRSKIRHLLGKTNHGHRAAVAPRGHVLQRGIEVLPAHDHRMRPVRLAISAASNGEVEVPHDKY